MVNNNKNLRKASNIYCPQNKFVLENWSQIFCCCFTMYANAFLLKQQSNLSFFFRFTVIFGVWLVSLSVFWTGICSLVLESKDWFDWQWSGERSPFQTQTFIDYAWAYFEGKGTTILTINIFISIMDIGWSVSCEK